MQDTVQMQISVWANVFTRPYLWMEWTETPPSVLSVSTLFWELRLDAFSEPLFLKPSAGRSETAEDVLCPSSKLLSETVGMYTDKSRNVIIIQKF